MKNKYWVIAGIYVLLPFLGLIEGFYIAMNHIHRLYVPFFELFFIIFIPMFFIMSLFSYIVTLLILRKIGTLKTINKTEILFLQIIVANLLPLSIIVLLNYVLDMTMTFI